MRPSHARAIRNLAALLVYMGAYVALFIGVPPVPVCLGDRCLLNPRPEAFLLAAALPYGAGAIMGVSIGVAVAAVLYEVMNPTGTTPVDAAYALLALLLSCLTASRYLRRRPTAEGAVASTWILTGLLTLLLGTYAALAKGSNGYAYMTVLSEALLPINVAGAALLIWLLRRSHRGGVLA